MDVVIKNPGSLNLLPLSKLDVTNRHTLSVFISDDKKLCAEGQRRTVEGALALFKAMPRGALYKNIFAHANGTSCMSRGYVSPGGEDVCYPGLMKFFKNDSDRFDFEKAEVK